MPYIEKKDREKLDSEIEDVIDALTNHGFKTAVVGDVNYVFSKIIWTLFQKNRSYTNGNNLVGVLECVKQEFIRRQLNPYENEKIAQNGDICEA
jgi:hypothetical protein